ncbi:hypothetical protein THRCLA_23250 [Thraustotheca clavata]|uniref:Uncharacterized protein n=1 Tax=Thraustotheca clavata TaxID=74557 RepID=A0A1V9Y8S6_9STRA|nr:hypothetical protein THRCLA_23250 [Thraustotheca clavata]
MSDTSAPSTAPLTAVPTTVPPSPTPTTTEAPTTTVPPTTSVPTTPAPTETPSPEPTITTATPSPVPTTTSPSPPPTPTSIVPPPTASPQASIVDDTTDPPTTVPSTPTIPPTSTNSTSASDNSIDSNVLAGVLGGVAGGCLLLVGLICYVRSHREEKEVERDSTFWPISPPTAILEAHNTPHKSLGFSMLHKATTSHDGSRSTAISDDILDSFAPNRRSSALFFREDITQPKTVHIDVVDPRASNILGTSYDVDVVTHTTGNGLANNFSYNVDKDRFSSRHSSIREDNSYTL